MGVPTPAIADILGHSTTRLVEDLYRHRSQKVQEEAAAKMQEALG
jgi:integrase